MLVVEIFCVNVTDTFNIVVQVVGVPVVWLTVGVTYIDVWLTVGMIDSWGDWLEFAIGLAVGVLVELVEVTLAVVDGIGEVEVMRSVEVLDGPKNDSKTVFFSFP